MTSVNTNNMAAMATRSSRAANAGQAQNIERLSTGLRVNSASDDAAGLAIAKNMEKQVSGYEVNARNANDAISLVQIAEGGMEVIGDMLQRMKDLALQSANDTNSTVQRANIQEEYSALMSEIDRIVGTTEFNGVNLLNGGFQNKDFQVDESASGNNVISISIDGIGTGQLTGDSGVKVYENISSNFTFAAGDFIFTYGASSSTETIADADFTTAGDLVAKINDGSGTHGVSAAIVGTDFVLYNSDGTNDATVTSTIALGGESVASAAVASGNTTLSSTSVSSQANASSALAIIDKASELVTTARAKLGASQNRLEKTIDNLSSKMANVDAAKGRIMDADFATESTDLAKNKVLVQAATSMLAQANQDGQNVLALLR
jgi:flagellin